MDTSEESATSASTVLIEPAVETSSSIQAPDIELVSTTKLEEVSSKENSSLISVAEDPIKAIEEVSTLEVKNDSPFDASRESISVENISCAKMSSMCQLDDKSVDIDVDAEVEENRSEIAPQNISENNIVNLDVDSNDGINETNSDTKETEITDALESAKIDLNEAMDESKKELTHDEAKEKLTNFPEEQADEQTINIDESTKQHIAANDLSIESNQKSTVLNEKSVDLTESTSDSIQLNSELKSTLLSDKNIEEINTNSAKSVDVSISSNIKTSDEQKIQENQSQISEFESNQNYTLSESNRQEREEKETSENTLESAEEITCLVSTEKPNSIEIDNELQNQVKKDENISEQMTRNEDENEHSSDDDVQFEKPNIMVIEIDDDDDDVPTIINSNKNENICEEKNSDMPLNDITKESLESMDVDTVVQSATDDVEMNETSVQESNDGLLKEADTNELLVETTKPPSPTPKSDTNLLTDDDTNGEVYYNKECVNYECAHKHKQFFQAPLFALSYYKITKKKFKTQFICAECYDQALEMYEEFSNLLAAKQPLLLKDIVGGRQEFVEIIDSSDEDDEDDKIDKSKDNKCFSKDDIKLIENELENSIRRVLDRVEIQNQLTWSKTILASRAKALEEETNYIDAELRLLQKKADNMHVTLYQCPKIKVRQLQPLDLNTGRPYATTDAEISLPPVGEILRPPITFNAMYYAVKNKAIASWVPCRVIEQVESPLIMKNVTHYKIRFLKSQYQPFKTVSVKHLAYYDPPNVRLPIGSRVIAYFDATSLSRGKEKMMIQSAFYPGIIAEPLKPNNKYRYLIFYDDGYTQYVYHKDVRLVCNVSDNVWEDVHPGSRDFIQKYLTQYSINRPMVQTQKGQSMTTESNGKWIYARVVDIDCSLIQMQFEGPKSHTEWIYRGSMRLGPVFKEHQKTMQKTTMPISRLPRRTEPFIRYTEDEEATSTQQQQQRQLQQQQNEPRAVAKKSVSRQESQNFTSQQFTPVPVVRHLNNSTIYLEDENKPKGKVVYYTAKRNLPPQTYKHHSCSPACLYKITHNLSAYSPLSKPLLSGWERLIIRQKIKKVVTYRGPCGKILRNMKELRNYLRITDNVLNVENFDFSPETNCLAEYVIESAIVQKRDISNGQEKMAIPLVNYYDNTMPPECKYSAKRIPTEGVNLNVDEEYLVGCDCDDDCSDKTKCSCWQLTYAGAKYGNPNTPIEEIGYQYKRLYEHVPTGIYECNSRCKCKSNCLNRVVQHSLEMKLQVFKTSNRGWGLRCINDVPRGSFMCVYAGHLLTEAKANEGGLDAGDEYFAELDYIEVAEQIKEGYESDVGSPEPEEEDELYDQEENDDEFTPSKPHNTRSKAKLQKTTRSSASQATDDDSQERQMINFNPNAVMDENSMRESSIRKLFGKDEACYVMDAKVTGNLGRYFNHSCSPNLFVQNVFVDTHDLRFPWVAFFALTHIRAGTELTWNYNYEVGVVPGKVLYCQCGAPNCRLRLL